MSVSISYSILPNLAYMKAKLNDIYRIVEDSFTACETERLISELQTLLEIKEAQEEVEA